MLATTKIIVTVLLVMCKPNCDLLATPTHKLDPLHVLKNRYLYVHVIM